MPVSSSSTDERYEGTVCSTFNVQPESNSVILERDDSNSSTLTYTDVGRTVCFLAHSNDSGSMWFIVVHQSSHNPRPTVLVHGRMPDDDVASKPYSSGLELNDVSYIKHREAAVNLKWAAVAYSNKHSRNGLDLRAVICTAIAKFTPDPRRYRSSGGAKSESEKSVVQVCNIAPFRTRNVQSQNSSASISISSANFMFSRLSGSVTVERT